MLVWRRIILSGLAAAFLVSAAQAADTVVKVAPQPPIVVAAPPPPPAEVVVVAPETAIVVPGPLVGPPTMPFGCRRVWRCDAQVCEWRRGCNGVYGYVEGPYYTKPLAMRQWERDGLPGPGTVTGAARSRTRVQVDPALK